MTWTVVAAPGIEAGGKSGEAVCFQASFTSTVPSGNGRLLAR
jgi:hypothetical protein